MFKLLKSKEKVSKIITTTLLLITSFSTSAYAWGKWTGQVMTPEGPVTKIYTDFNNATWWPFQISLSLSIIVALVLFLVDAKNIIKDIYTPKEKLLSNTDIVKGKMPDDIAESDNSLTKGIAQIRESDPNFSVTDFIEQVDKLYRHSIKGRLTRNWGGAVYSIPAPILLTLEKSPIKVSKYKPLIPELKEIRSYNTGTDKAIIKLKGIGETKSDNAILETYEEEIWTLERFKGIQSKHNYDMTTCPNCGNVEIPDEDGKCTNCGIQTGEDKNGWIVIITDRVQTKPITSYQGIKLIDRKDTLTPTVIQPNLAPKIEWIKKRNPSFSEEDMLEKVKYMISVFYSNLVGNTEANKVICSELFFRNITIDGEIIKRDLTNRQLNLTGINIYNIKPTRVIPDPYLDIITYRIWGQIELTNAQKEQKECMFSDYVTLCREIDKQEWKIWNLESPTNYRE